MIKSSAPYWLLIVFVCHSFTSVIAQETIFNGFKKEVTKGDEYFANESYHKALSNYLNAKRKNKGGADIDLKIATTYYFLADYKKAIPFYENAKAQQKQWASEDQLRLATSYQNISDYKNAIQLFGEYILDHPNDLEVKKKIWRLNNMSYLFEDSSYYHVSPMTINTKYSEFGASYFKEGIVFLSNRQTVTAFEKIDESTDQGYFDWYYFSELNDTSGNEKSVFGKVRSFGTSVAGKYHKGTLSFSASQDSMVYCANDKKGKQLQLFFAHRVNNKWIKYAEFEYNSLEYSISHPSLSADGNTLVFSSNMDGSLGGLDLFICYKNGNSWSLPSNMGTNINTSGDESYPFIAGNALYFSSTGHGGLGGMDVFKIDLRDTTNYEASNLGYPINTFHDDFAFVLSSDGSEGFLSSNREGEQTKDDIYRVKIELQTFPLVINGLIKVKDHASPDNQISILPNALVELIDHASNIEVGRTTSDESGLFSLEIPYSSQYFLKIRTKELGENIVSLELPKTRKKEFEHDIVVVKQLFISDIEE